MWGIVMLPWSFRRQSERTLCVPMQGSASAVLHLAFSAWMRYRFAAFMRVLGYSLHKRVWLIKHTRLQAGLQAGVPCIFALSAGGCHQILRFYFSRSGHTSMSTHMRLVVHLPSALRLLKPRSTRHTQPETKSPIWFRGHVQPHYATSSYGPQKYLFS